jgi:hypothetical protein
MGSTSSGSYLINWQEQINIFMTESLQYTDGVFKVVLAEKTHDQAYGLSSCLWQVERSLLVAVRIELFHTDLGFVK